MDGPFIVHYMEVELELRQSMISFYEGFPPEMERSRISNWNLRHFPEWCPGAGQARSPWRLDDRDPALPDFPSLMTSTLTCYGSDALLQYFPHRFFCLSFWHTAGGGLKRRGKISLAYSQERKKLVKQIIWIFTAARFNGRHLYKNCRLLPLVLLLFTCKR